jgi:glutaredoxin
MVFETDADTATHLPIHTTPTCPSCDAQNAWLDREGIDFNEGDLTYPVVTE